MYRALPCVSSQFHILRQSHISALKPDILDAYHCDLDVSTDKLRRSNYQAKEGFALKGC